MSKTTKRVLIAAAGLILATSIVGSFVSRQNLRASQNKSQPVTTLKDPLAKPLAPAAKPPAPPVTPAPETRASKPAESAPEDVVNPAVSSKQILNGSVRTLWESGRYTQALALVNQVLASDPANDDARSWKTKIREAQAAEAALK